jgi:hypothetical protein
MMDGKGGKINTDRHPRPCSFSLEDQSRTLLDVVLERFGGVVPEIGLNRSTAIHGDIWIKSIRRRIDRNLRSCKIYIKSLKASYTKEPAESGFLNNFKFMNEYIAKRYQKIQSLL